MSKLNRKAALEARREKARRKWQRLKERRGPGCVDAYFEYERLMPKGEREIMDAVFHLTAEESQRSPETLKELSLVHSASLGGLREMTVDEIIRALKKAFAVGILEVVADEERMWLAPSRGQSLPAPRGPLR